MGVERKRPLHLDGNGDVQSEHFLSEYNQICYDLFSVIYRRAEVWRYARYGEDGAEPLDDMFWRGIVESREVLRYRDKGSGGRGQRCGGTRQGGGELERSG